MKNVKSSRLLLVFITVFFAVSCGLIFSLVVNNPGLMRLFGYKGWIDPYKLWAPFIASIPWIIIDLIFNVIVRWGDLHRWKIASWSAWGILVTIWLINQIY